MTAERLIEMVKTQSSVIGRYEVLVDKLNNNINQLEVQLAVLTQAVVERDLIIGQYIAEVQQPKQMKG